MSIFCSKDDDQLKQAIDNSKWTRYVSDHYERQLDYTLKF